MAIIPSNFDERVNALIVDLEGHDEWFYHESQMRTIYWWMARLKSIHEATAVYRSKGEKTRFIQAVAAGYKKMNERRIWEGLAVYQRFSKPSDSLKDSCERIFNEKGNWTAALSLKAPKEEQTNPPACKHCALHCGETKTN